MGTHREVETTYAPDPAADVPDLTDVEGITEVRSQPSVELSAVYFDTDDLRLLRSGVSLRRRTGGSDEGWHVKVPANGARDEIHRPLGRSSSVPPKTLRDLVLGWTRGAPLLPIATVTTDRSPIQLLGAHGEVLAEFTDDRVVGATPDGGEVRWREWELELVDGTPDLLDAADEHLATDGVTRADVGRKVARVLGDRYTPPPPLPPPDAREPVSRLVHMRLAQQVDRLARQDVEVRQGDDAGVHSMRVTCRRLRAVLATFRPVLDREQTDPVREEVRWLVGVLGEARDATVVQEKLRRLLADEPPSMVQGPVEQRLRATYDGRGKPELHAALESPRYLALREHLDRLVADPPWSEQAEAPAGEVVPTRLRKELTRFKKRVRAAAQAEQPIEALHEARKAAKRLRYAAETIEPIGGKPAHRLVRAARHVTSDLGELQDTAVSRAELKTLSAAAAAAGEPSFTYGRLHGREQARAERLVEAFWEQDALDRLKSKTRKAAAAARGD
jgi:CHAD domain-containing protein